MKKIALSLLIASFSMSFASYQVVFPNQQINFKNIPPETFTPAEPFISDCANVGSQYGCSNYTPDAADFDLGVVFIQTTNNCKMDQERTIQQRQISSVTHALSNVGVATVERQVLNNQSNSRNATGTRPETFTPTTPLISEWADVKSIYGCSNYTPDASGYAYGVVFTQTANNCKIDQERSVQNRQISSITSAISNVGEPVIEQQTLSDQKNNKEATGTRYNYTMRVGSYNYGSTYYYGYFSDHYMSQFGAGIVTNSYPSISSSTFRGSTIDHLVEQGGYITMRVLPDITGAMPVITINGKPCTLVGPNVYTAYDGLCNFNLGNYVGQTIYIDLR